MKIIGISSVVKNAVPPFAESESRMIVISGVLAEFLERDKKYQICHHLPPNLPKKELARIKRGLFIDLISKIMDENKLLEAEIDEIELY